MENEPAVLCHVTELTKAQREYYGIREIQGEIVRKEILIAQEYIINHCEKKLTWEILSEVINLSPGYLQKLYRKWCLLRLHDFQNLCRMEKAAGYLRDTTITVKEVCEAVGIRNTSYFSALFRKTYGVTPTLYRHIYG